MGVHGRCTEGVVDGLVLHRKLLLGAPNGGVLVLTSDNMIAQLTGGHLAPPARAAAAG